jgi:hypothetical protein
MLLSLALSTALVLPSRHAPVLMQQQGQYVVEPPPPKGFVWSTFSDMTGSVTPTSFVAATPSAKTPAKAPFSQLYSTITAVPASLKQPAIIPAETSISESVDQLGSMAVEEEKTRIVAPAWKSRFVLPVCMLVTFLSTGGAGVSARALSAGSASMLVGLGLKLGWRFGVAFGLCSAFRARPLTAE